MESEFSKEVMVRATPDLVAEAWAWGIREGYEGFDAETHDTVLHVLESHPKASYMRVLQDILRMG